MLSHWSIRLATITGLAGTTMTAPSPAPRCLDGRLPALQRGHASGPHLCERPGITFRSIGQITAGPRRYHLYDDRYTYRPVGAAVNHGGQRLLLFDQAGEYVGQYNLSPPPFLHLSITDTRMLVASTAESADTADWSGGPPPSMHLAGDVTALFR